MRSKYLAVFFYSVVRIAGGDQDAMRFDVASIRQSPGPAFVQNADPELRDVLAQTSRMMAFNSRGPGLRFTSPGYFRSFNIDLQMLIAMAFGVSLDDVRGPAWMKEVYFNVEARAAPETTPAQGREMLAQLLRDRFALDCRTETVSARGYKLVIGSGGARVKLAESAELESNHGTPLGPGSARRGNNLSPPDPGVKQLRMPRATADKIAAALSDCTGFPVADQTGLSGQYDVELRFAVHDERSCIAAARGFGLDLKRSHVDLRTVLVESVRRVPTAN